MSDTITVTGNIAADPEGKRTASGVAITTFRVASTHRRFDRAEGRWVDEYTNWYSVSAFRGLAEHALRSLHKGDRVVLTGRLRVRDWETSTSRGTAVEITADSIGHDLLWGTTQFLRASAPRATDGGAPPLGQSVNEWDVAPIGAAEASETGAADATANWGAQLAVDEERTSTVAAGEGSPRDLVGADTPF